MSIIIFMFGMLLASILAISIYGNMGVPPSHEKNWVDYLFWGIILASLLPVLVEDIILAWKYVKKQFLEFCHHYIDICH